MPYPDRPIWNYFPGLVLLFGGTRFGRTFRTAFAFRSLAFTGCLALARLDLALRTGFLAGFFASFLRAVLRGLAARGLAVLRVLILAGDAAAWTAKGASSRHP